MKKILSITLAALLALCTLSSCGKKQAETETSSSDSESISATENQDEAIAEAENENVKAEKTTSKPSEKSKKTNKTKKAEGTTQSTTKKKIAEWKEQYLKILEESYYYNSSNAETANLFHYSLIDFNSDNIPELVVSDGGSHFNFTKIYSYKNGILSNTDNIGSNGKFAYSGNKIVGMFTSGAGGTVHSIEVWEVKEDSFLKVFSGRQTCGDGEPFHFYSNEIEVSQEEFVRLYNEYVPNQVMVTGYSSATDGFDLSLFTEEYGCKKVKQSSSSEKIYTDAKEFVKAKLS